jgi:hypothetical protein
MTAGIDKLAADLVKEYARRADGGRQNELTIELKLSLNAFANRIDQGYNVDVRAGDPPDEGEEGSEVAASEEYKTISATRAGLQFINRTGEPILGLPEPDGAQERGEDRVTGTSSADDVAGAPSATPRNPRRRSPSSSSGRKTPKEPPTQESS